MIKDDLAYIEHILDCIRKINEFSNGLSLKEFKTNEMVQDAIQYRTRSCKSCPAHSHCTRSKNGRILSRTKFAEYYEANRKAYQEKEHLYKRRQAIVEHPYGTIKRQWDSVIFLPKEG